MDRVSRRALVGIVLAAVAARVVLLLIPFGYIPDVYYYDTQAVQALLSGADPYGHHYVVPAWLATTGAENVFAYLPGVVLFLLPFGVAGDVRLGLIACDVLVALGLYSLGGRRAGTASALYLLLPFTVLFSTWYPNDTLVGMAMLGVAVAMKARKWHLLSAVFVGVSVASSQLVWLFYPFLLLVELRAKRYKETALGLGVAAAVVTPFLLWNPSAFLHNAVLFELGRPVQGLVTPQTFGFNVNPTLSGLVATFLGLSVPLLFKAAVLTALLGLLLFRTSSFPKALLNGSCFLLAAIFVLPNNFSWWYLELPLQTLLAWFLVSRGAQAEPPVNP